MNIRAVLVRVLIAVICVVLIYALIPPLSSVLGFSITGDVMQIVRIIVAGFALLYILFGPSPAWPTS